MEFLDWLESKKGFSQRGAKDVVCRLKRAYKIVGSTKTSTNTISLLQNLDQYKDLSRYIRPQLKRACELHLEYLAALQRNFK